MLIAIVLVFTLYTILVTRTAMDWRQMKCPDGDTRNEALSLIIAVRNEEENLPSLFEAIKTQDYSNDLYEVIFVDDHSTDRSSELIINESQHQKQIKLYKNEGEGKKSAITTGVGEASNNWILVTDADCTFGPQWLSSYATKINSDQKMVFGPIAIESNNFVGDFQDFEQSALISIGAVSLNNGYPTMINAANMAFSKSAFMEVGGYKGNEKIPTGDDEFLLKAIHKKYPQSISFLKCEDLVVRTGQAITWKELVNQRRRWASKWRKQKFPLFAISIALFYALFIGLTIWGTVNREIWVAVFIFAKFIADYLLIKENKRFHRLRVKFIPFCLSQILYPVYAIVIAILANFGSYSWKDRKYKLNE